MKIEVTCPNGHVIAQHGQGSLSFSIQERRRLNVDVYCPACGLRWEMSLELSLCEGRKTVDE